MISKFPICRCWILLNICQRIGSDNHKERLSNWMTRSLTLSPPTAVLTENDVQKATQILKEKCLVLLYDKMEGSIERLKKLFFWESDIKKVGSQKCLNDLSSENPFDEKILTEDDEAWKSISAYNEWDIMLYENLRLLFQKQGVEIFGNLIEDMDV